MEKSLQEFSKRKDIGYQYECKDCNSKRNKEYSKKWKAKKDKIIPLTKICFTYKIEKNFSDFHKRNTRKDGLCAYCKICVLKRNSEKEYKQQRAIYGLQYRKNSIDQRRNYNLKKSYGVTLEQKKEMFEKQERKCAICPRTIENVNVACLDHEHITKKIREILCRKCNSAIGLLGDDPEICDNAAAYIRKHRDA